MVMTSAPPVSSSPTGGHSPVAMSNYSSMQPPSQQQPYEPAPGPDTNRHSSTLHEHMHTLAIDSPTERSPPPNGAMERSPVSPNSPLFQERLGREQEQRQNFTPRERSRTNGSRRPSGSRACGKCGGSLTGQFVRALGDTYHLECFTCHVRKKPALCKHGFTDP